MSDIFERAVQDPCSIDVDAADNKVKLPKKLPQNHELRKVKTAPHFNTHHYNKSQSHTELRRTMTYIRPSRTDSSLFVQQEARRPSFMLSQNDSRDKNFCNVIPTHIYGSEKYISSQLDELSTDYTAKYEGDDDDDDDTTDSSVFESRDTTLPMTVPTPPMKRRSSSIKFSLANSFSSN